MKDIITIINVIINMVFSAYCVLYGSYCWIKNAILKGGNKEDRNYGVILMALGYISIIYAYIKYGGMIR